MKLSEIKGEDALDVIADIIEPATRILANETVAETLRSGKPTILKAKAILKYGKAEVLEILAILNQQKVEDFKPSILELPVMLMDLISDLEENKELMSLFSSSAQMKEDASSGGAMETTMETEEV